MEMSATVNTRINPALKSKAESILHKIGLTSAEAVRLFYTQVCLNKGIPFKVNIPNKTTIKAMKDADAGRTHKVDSIDELFSELL
jgi:DNA-damage-inducible protein J